MAKEPSDPTCCVIHRLALVPSGAGVLGASFQIAQGERSRRHRVIEHPLISYRAKVISSISRPIVRKYTIAQCLSLM